MCSQRRVSILFRSPVVPRMPWTSAGKVRVLSDIIPRYPLPPWNTAESCLPLQLGFPVLTIFPPLPSICMHFIAIPRWPAQGLAHRGIGWSTSLLTCCHAAWMGCKNQSWTFACLHKDSMCELALCSYEVCFPHDFWALISTSMMTYLSFSLQGFQWSIVHWLTSF